ncbi:hypothetical protein ACWWD9_12120 [Methylovorus sp. SPW-M1]
MMIIKRLLRMLLILTAISYFFWLSFMRADPFYYQKCDLYTEEMNGGVKTFQGRQYNIKLCGLRGRIDPSNVQDDEILLRVYSMQGELLAERYFEFYWGLRELRYGKDYLMYADGDGEGYATKMTMPPTRLDWIRARLPRLWP